MGFASNLLLKIDASLLRLATFRDISLIGKFPLRDLKLFFGKDENKLYIKFAKCNIFFITFRSGIALAFFKLLFI